MHTNPHRRCSTRTTGALLVAILATTCEINAQTASSTDQVAAEPRDETVVLSPFTVSSQQDYGYRKTNAVTATRFGVSINDTPLSISIISRELLDDLGIDTAPQAFSYGVSSINVNYDNQTTLTGQGSIRIRGFSSAFIYQDGVRRYNTFHLDAVDRVEVVKGPVGLFFGRSDPGGIINFITKKPEFIKQSVLDAKYGSDDFVKGLLDSQGVSENGKMAYRLVGSWRESDSWMAYTHWNEKYLLAEVAFRPVKGLDILVQGEHINQKKTGGRVPALVANLDYLKAAGVFGGPITLKSTLQDADSNPSTPPVMLYESVGKWARRQYAETGKDVRDYTGYYFPRGHSWNRNGEGALDNNKSDSVNVDLRYQPTDQLNLRLVLNRTKTDATTFWFINQDPGQAPADELGTFYAIPAYQAAYANNGNVNLFTGMNYGFFESPFFNRTGTGGALPGKQADLNTIDTVQLDASYKFDAFGGKHTLLASAEYIGNQYTQYSYIVDVDKFVAAGGFPANWYGEGFGPLSAASTAELERRKAILQGYGVMGADYPISIFSGLFGNLADPNFTPPNMSSWLAGRSANSVGGSDSVDSSYSVSYQGKFLHDRLTFSLGTRYTIYEAIAAAQVGGDRSRSGNWATFKQTTPTVGVLYALNKSTNVYASYSQNFFPTRTVPQDLIRNTVTGEQRGGDILAPESGEGFEIGAKTISADGVFSGSVALFRIDRNKIPVTDTVFIRRAVEENNASGGVNPWVDVTQGNVPMTYGSGGTIEESIGRQRVEGIEVEGVYTPSRQLQVILAGSYNFTHKWVAMPPAAVNISRGGTFDGDYGNDGRDVFDQNVLQNCPTVQFSVFGKYTFAANALKGLDVGLGARWQSKELVLFRDDGTFDTYSPDAYQEPYTVVDASLGYRLKFGKKPIQLTLSVLNVLNKEYLSGTFGPAPTREWKLTARYTF